MTNILSYCPLYGSLKDFLALSGTLGVSHLMCFSTTETGHIKIYCPYDKYLVLLSFVWHLMCFSTTETGHIKIYCPYDKYIVLLSFVWHLMCFSTTETGQHA